MVMLKHWLVDRCGKQTSGEKNESMGVDGMYFLDMGGLG